MTYQSGRIVLRDEEQALLDEIMFDTRHVESPHVVRANGDKVLRLLALLRKRRAIPAPRLRYFTQPEFNIGGHGKSYKEGFEKNGCRGADIVRHPNFLPYFRYMVLGPSLPMHVLQAFTAAVTKCGDITSGDILPLAQTARQLTRASGLPARESAEEFFRLALDLGMDAIDARTIRDQVLTLKS